jgi:hypothetical protein
MTGRRAERTALVNRERRHDADGTLSVLGGHRDGLGLIGLGAARLHQQADDAGDAVQDAYRCRALRTTASSRPAEVSW